LSDDHFLKWASRGAKLHRLTLFHCQNITDIGLIPLLENSGRVMNECWLDNCREVTKITWRFLLDNCRRVKNVRVCDEDYCSKLKLFRVILE
jgi:hypothetical protein